MDMSEIRRLEDRIEASNHAWQIQHDAANREWWAKFEASKAASDARLDIALARIDTRFERMEGRMDHMEKSISGLRSTVIGTGIAVVALVIGIMAYGQSWFGVGLTTRDIIRAVIAEQHLQTLK